MQQLNEQQIKQYNSYRAEGLSPERALSLATKDSDNQYNPALEQGVDNILFGKNSLGSAAVSAVKNAAFSGVKTIYDDYKDYGAGFAAIKAPLSLVAGVGRGVGDVVGGVIETADDLTGEVASNALKPVVEKAVNSDVGQYLINKGIELDQKGRGIPSDIFDALGVLGLTGALKSAPGTALRQSILNRTKGAVEGVKNFKSGGGSLSDFIPKAPKVGAVKDKIVDTAIEGTVKTVNAVKKIPQAISDSARKSIDRRITRIAATDPTKAAENILDLYKRSVVPGVKKKNKTIPNIEKINESVKKAVPDLAKKYDVEDLEDFANAISTEKKAIFAEIEKGLAQATENKKVIDTSPIVKELDELLSSERAEFSKPLRDAIEKTKRELVEELPDGTVAPKSISPSGAQDLIADLNAQLQSYYRGSTSGTNADVIVDNLVVNNLRKSVDDVVENLGEGSFKQLKSRYTDLKRMEDDVVHRAIFESQKGRGLGDLTDILSAGDIAAGALDPAFFAKGVTQYLTKEVIKSLSDKDELVRQMFLYGKFLNAN